MLRSVMKVGFCREDILDNHEVSIQKMAWKVRRSLTFFRSKKEMPQKSLSLHHRHISHYLQGFVHPRWLFGISEPSTVRVSAHLIESRSLSWTTKKGGIFVQVARWLKPSPFFICRGWRPRFQPLSSDHVFTHHPSKKGTIAEWPGIFFWRALFGSHCIHGKIVYPLWN